MSQDSTPKLTPMLQQYLDIKAQHADKVLFFRLGDFYEMFLDDAREVSRLLNLTLTKRGDVPMCGIPYHAAKNYIKRLLEEGKKIAVCEQVEMPTDARTLAKREVVQIITPATVVDDDYLDALSSSYLFCFYTEGNTRLSLAITDISSGEFLLEDREGPDFLLHLRSLLAQYRPKEILVDEDDYFGNQEIAGVVDEARAMVTKLPHSFFSGPDGYSLMCGHLGIASLKSFGINQTYPALGPGGAVLRYLMDTARSTLSQISTYRIVSSGHVLHMDEATRRNLEIVTNIQDGSTHFTLFDAVNYTKTAGGTRLLKTWLVTPITDELELKRRQDWIELLLTDSAERQRVRGALSTVLDMVRLTSRVAMARAIPHDLVSIRQTLQTFFSLISQDFERYHVLLDEHVDAQRLEKLVSVMQEIAKAINEECRGPFEEDRVILDGYDQVLDELRGLRDHGSDILQDYLLKVREETGITTLKLSFNKIIGHYLEVSKGQIEKVPASFYRKQTLVNAERYTTDELVDCETRILKAVHEAERRERAVYSQILDDVRENLESLLAIGRFLSELDVYQSHATLAFEKSYVRPIFTQEDILDIQEGRHPVVENTMRVGAFISNNLCMEEQARRFCLITGPNMAGKSTYLRQNALIVLLAQSGSYVPASQVTMGLVDRLYCRVGASDNLARGESTFLVEMQEAAHIVRTATRRSFVIMDEIGRGTSTQDGMSIAYAIMTRLQEMGSKTLFATHYHELTMLDTSNMQLLTLEVVQKAHKIVFMRKVIDGVANSSYGLHVAALAGIPADIVKSAATFQRKHFSDYSMSAPEQLDLFLMDEEPVVRFVSAQTMEEDEKSVISPEIQEILKQLARFDVDGSSPRAALDFVADLQEKLGK